MALNGSVVVNELIQIIHSEAGVNASRLSEHSRLNHDCGIGGDDMGDILKRVDIEVHAAWGTSAANRLI
jgi:hypothetical protein